MCFTLRRVTAWIRTTRVFDKCRVPGLSPDLSIRISVSGGSAGWEVQPQETADCFPSKNLQKCQLRHPRSFSPAHEVWTSLLWHFIALVKCSIEEQGKKEVYSFAVGTGPRAQGP